jgi:hypothetical protein
VDVLNPDLNKPSKAKLGDAEKTFRIVKELDNHLLVLHDLVREADSCDEFLDVAINKELALCMTLIAWRNEKTRIIDKKNEAYFLKALEKIKKDMTDLIDYSDRAIGGTAADFVT